MEHMEHMEIERKFLIDALPEALSDFPHQEYLQGYLSTSPTLRVRREGETYVLTYKGSGLMKRTEYNLPLTAESFAHLLEKCDGLRIEKTRYRIPLSGTELTAELDVFHGALSGLWLVEVEFPDEESAARFLPPARARGSQALLTSLQHSPDGMLSTPHVKHVTHPTNA